MIIEIVKKKTCWMSIKNDLLDSEPKRILVLENIWILKMVEMF